MSTTYLPNFLLCLILSVAYSQLLLMVLLTLPYVHCHDLDSNPKTSPAFKGLLNNLMDYNATKVINRTGQMTLLYK